MVKRLKLRALAIVGALVLAFSPAHADICTKLTDDQTVYTTEHGICKDLATPLQQGSTMYATPLDYVTRFQPSEAALMLGSSNQSINSDVLLALVQGEDMSGYPADEVSAAASGVARLEKVLESKSRHIDSYLATKHDVPLNPLQLSATSVPECALVLTHYALANVDDRMSEAQQLEHKNWLAWLKDIGAGNASVPGLTLSNRSGVGGRQMVAGQPRSAVNWDHY